MKYLFIILPIIFLIFSIFLSISMVDFIWDKGGVWLWHNIFRWHMPDESAEVKDNMLHSHCRYCKKEIILVGKGVWRLNNKI